MLTFPYLQTAGNRSQKIHHNKVLAKSLHIALAAAACAEIWLGFPAIQTGAMADHRTAVGQSSRIVLSDGSVVTLGGHSAIAVHYSADRRNVTVLAGEALFDVLHDPHRPFQVKAGILQARDIGTRFDIRMDSTQIRVDVHDGRVGVSRQMEPSLPETRLGPGDELALDLQTGKISHITVDPDRIGKWRDQTPRGSTGALAAPFQLSYAQSYTISAMPLDKALEVLGKKKRGYRSYTIWL